MGIPGFLFVLAEVTCVPLTVAVYTSTPHCNQIELLKGSKRRNNIDFQSRRRKLIRWIIFYKHQRCRKVNKISLSQNNVNILYLRSSCTTKSITSVTKAYIIATDCPWFNSINSRCRFQAEDIALVVLRLKCRRQLRVASFPCKPSRSSYIILTLHVQQTAFTDFLVYNFLSRGN